MRRGMAAMTSLLLMTTLTGCVETTQQKSARAKLTADRLLATQQPVQVTRTNPQVSVTGLAVLRHDHTTAFAVTLHNGARGVVSDLPISVGLSTRAGHRDYLNRQANLPYFQTHVGAIAAGDSTTWVFAQRVPVPSGGQPFALVGLPSVTDQAGVTRLPRLTSTLTAARSKAGDTVVTATITNHSGVPQLGLAVYASALSAGRLLAAGQTSVAQLNAHSSVTVAVSLVGDPGGAAAQLDTPPTNLR